jgi:hypothetical protein
MTGGEPTKVIFCHSAQLEKKALPSDCPKAMLANEN